MNYVLLQSLRIAFVLENSADPDEMPRSVAFYLALCSFKITCFRVPVVNGLNYIFLGYLTFDEVKSGNIGQRAISDIHLQTVKIQMRRLIRIFTVCLVNLFLFQ